MNRDLQKKLRFGEIKKFIYGRAIFLLLGFLAQFVLMMIAYYKLSNYSFWFYILFLIISVVSIIDIYNDGGNPDMKLSWMLLIAILPVFGAIFYATIQSRPGTRKLRISIQEQRKINASYLHKPAGLAERMAEEDPRMAGLVKYLNDYDGGILYTNTEAEYFPIGEAQFTAMKRELEKAEKFIFIEFFIVCEGKMLDELLEILWRKALEGVEIRFLYDGTNMLINLPSYFSKLIEREGMKAKAFAPIRMVFSPHYNNRDHRKILVIDGQVAFTGGINIADEYINEKERFGHWKDTGVMLRGDGVERMTYLFLEMWNASGKPEEDLGQYRPCRRKEQSISGQVEEYALGMDHAMEHATDANRMTGYAQGYVVPYSVSPLGRERVGEKVYLDLIDTAHRYLHIMTPYLILDHQMIDALTYAAKRGVDVKIIMPHIPDKPYAFVLAKTYYNQLLEAGVQIYEYEPGFVHAKVMVADDEKAVVGTVNMDYRSLYHHFECGVLFYRHPVITNIEADVQDTLTKSIPATKDDYKNQKWYVRLQGRLMRFIAPLM